MTETTEEFYIGQVFAGEYTPQAAKWANENNAYIEELEAVEGVRQFEIKAVPEPTEEEIRMLKVSAIKTKLDELDLKSIRAIRANDTEYIQKYEAEAVGLRNQLAEL